MSEKITPYKDSELGKKQQIAKMFDTISNEYDGLNRVISFGIDIKWRNKVVQLVADTHPKNILDIATGTGDLAINLTRTNATQNYWVGHKRGYAGSRAEKNIKKRTYTETIDMVVGDSENLPFDDSSFDAITVAFGVRNFENLEVGLAEILRVLKPGGIFVVLETSVPTKFPFKQGYYLHTNVI